MNNMFSGPIKIGEDVQAADEILRGSRAESVGSRAMATDPTASPANSQSVQTDA
jgi:hypothetical protein